MSRRKLLFLAPMMALTEQDRLPSHDDRVWAQPVPSPVDDWTYNWEQFRAVWNPFAERMNQGVFEVKMWEKVREKFHKVEGVKTCK